MTEENRYWLEREFVLELLKQLPAQVFWKNSEGVYLGCNDAFARSVGLPSVEEVIGRNDYDLPTKKEESDAYRKDDQQVMASRQPKLNIEEEQTLADGRIANLLTSKVPLFNNDNEVIGILGIYYDISELKRTEKALELAKNQAEAASKAKSEFLANMSHDIRTPLTGIIGMAEELENSGLSLEKRVEYAKQLASAGKLLLNLLNQIIDVSRFDQGNIIAKNSVFDLRKLVQTVVNLLKPSIENKNLSFLLDYDKRIPALIKGPEILLHRVILNLMSNAIKFTELGSITCAVQWVNQDEQSVHVQLKIKDTGIGISKSQQLEIFNSFKRLSPSYKGEYQGVGLGLYIVKAFVTQMGGTITIDSDTNKGSTFTCDLTFEVAHQEQQEPIQDVLHDLIPDSLGEEKIGNVLLVEDDALAATVTMLKLQRLHLLVDHVNDGTMALLQMKQSNYDLIYLDIGLPGISGDTIAKEFRAWEKKHRRKITPLIGLTAHVDYDHKQLCLEHGIDLVLQKPLRAEIAKKVFAIFVLHSKEDREAKLRSILMSVKKNIIEYYDIEAWEKLVELITNLNHAVTYLGTIPLKVVVNEFESILVNRLNTDEFFIERVKLAYLKLSQEIDHFISIDNQ